MTRNAKIALMKQRGEEWRKAHPAKIPKIRIQEIHVSHRALLRLPIHYVADLKEIHCNSDGWEFIKALDPENDLRPTVAMVLAALDKMSKNQKAP